MAWSMSGNIKGPTGATGPAASLTTVNAALSADTSALAGNAWQSVLSTPTLAVGTWLVSAALTATPSANNVLDVRLTIASGTATLTGPGSGSYRGISGQPGQLAIPGALVVVTANAVVTLQTFMAGSANTVVVNAASAQAAARATAISAIKIA